MIGSLPVSGLKKMQIYVMQVEAEVSRLEELKSSRMKELVLKKRLELEEMCRKLHMVPAEDSAIEYVIDAIDSGILPPSTLFC